MWLCPEKSCIIFKLNSTLNTHFFERVAARLSLSEHRRRVQLVLIVSIILLQLLVLLLWYNESVNEDKLTEFDQAIQQADASHSVVDQANTDFYEAQASLQDYLQFRDVASLDNYFSLLHRMTSALDTLTFNPAQQEKLNRSVARQKRLQFSLEQVKGSIDSVFKSQELYATDAQGMPLKLNKINYKDILDSVEVESHLEADSLERKGLFTRLLNAFSGKVEIKKEILNQKVTMKYGKQEEIGSIEEQLKNVFENSDKHYQQQFRIIQHKYSKLRQRDQQLLLANKELSEQSRAVLAGYKAYFASAGTESKQAFQQQQDTNQNIRFYAILGIVLIMLLLSALLLFFTRLAFANERKLIAAQETIQQNLTFKNKIVGMLSHEIRSPLSLISIYSKKVSQQVEDAEAQEVFKTIQFTTNSLLVMVNQVLDFSKNERTRLQLNRKPFDLEAELRQMTHNLSTLVENSGNRLEVHTNLTEPCRVNSDATKIHQLLYNIIGNANKFTDKGVIRLQVDCQLLNQQHYHVRFEVQDNGRGISESDLNIIFEGFYKGINATKINDVGTGLGLNLCKEIVELFDGNISIDSKPNHGTKVVFTLLLDRS